MELLPPHKYYNASGRAARHSVEIEFTFARGLIFTLAYNPT